MKPYKNLSGNAGVKAYSIGADYIDILFISGETYRYTYQSAGKTNIEAMKKLAEKGKGLSTYINTHPQVKNGYERIF